MNSLLNTISRFFGVSKSESRGLLLLVFFCFLMLCITFLQKHPFFSPKPTISIIVTQTEPVAKITADEPKYTEDTEAEDTQPVNSRELNKIDLDFLLKIGVSRKISFNINKYLEKGGHFKDYQALDKIYNIEPTDITLIKKHTFLPQLKNREKEVRENIKEKEQILVKHANKPQLSDINTIDSAGLTLIKGIGPVLAARIVKYRKKLGGYVTPDQYIEVYGISDFGLVELKKTCVINAASLPQKININGNQFSEIAAHPYFGYKKSKILQNYIKHNGTIKSWDMLKTACQFTDLETDKLKMYFSID
jgi:competence protein ComEA